MLSDSRCSTGNCSPITFLRVTTPLTTRRNSLRMSVKVGMHEAPRARFLTGIIDKGAFSNYQAVVPTTWNASPRDEKGVPGPYETSLMRIHGGPQKPLEVLRTVHSFDPCMACAVTRSMRAAARSRGESVMSTKFC